MATMAPVPVPAKAGVEKCRVRDKLMFAFLLAVNRMNEDSARVEFALTPQFREEARVVLEQSRRKSKKLQGLILLHCLNHKC
jgi:hypothetical protein